MPFGPMGYKPDWRMVESYLAEAPKPCFGAAAMPLRDSGKGKRSLLFQIVKEIAGSYLHISQTIGDCTTMMGYKMVDYTACIEVNSGEQEEFAGMTASEPMYGYARVEVARGAFGNGDGCNGSCIVKALQAGTLLRQKYTVGGKTYDFTEYSGAKARDMGRKGRGVPDDLEPTMREHPIRTASLVTTYEEVRDGAANGYVTGVCSSQGFNDKRDEDGFLKPSGSWSHALFVCGVDDNPDRPCVIIDNSWPVSWVSGPMGEYEIPPGSFKVDADVFEKRMLRANDSYIVSGYDGYPKRNPWI